MKTPEPLEPHDHLAEDFPSELEIIGEPVPEEPTKAVDPLDDFQRRERNAEVRRKEHELSEAQSTTNLRIAFSGAIFLMCALWLHFIARIICECGGGVRKLDDSVLIALITTTTLNVLGLFYIVANWLFPKPKEDAPPAKEKAAAKTKEAKKADK